MSVACMLRCTCDLHAFPLHDVDIVLGACVITVQAQGSPEVRPQLAMPGDEGTNYISAGKQKAQRRYVHSVRVDKTHLVSASAAARSLSDKSNTSRWGNQPLRGKI